MDGDHTGHRFGGDAHGCGEGVADFVAAGAEVIVVRLPSRPGLRQAAEMLMTEEAEHTSWSAVRERRMTERGATEAYFRTRLGYRFRRAARGLRGRAIGGKPSSKA